MNELILGIQNVRLAVNGATLRSARNVSMTVFGGGTGSVSLTLAVMQFGQFINHDMESTAQFAFCNNFSKFVQCFKVINEIEFSQRIGHHVLQLYRRNASSICTSPGLSSH